MSVKMPVRKAMFLFKLCYLGAIAWLFYIVYREPEKKRFEVIETIRSRYVKIDPLNTSREFEKEIWRDVLKIKWEYGQDGSGVNLDNMTRRCGEDSVLINGYNVQLSAEIPVKRMIRDLRHPFCSKVVYDKVLPSAAVIIAFHNEPLSILLRSIWSVVSTAVNRDLPGLKSAHLSPLKEILLVDDCSSNVELKGKLAHYVKTRLPPKLVKILRLSKSLGPLRAKLQGARSSDAEVLVFLDPHIEVQRDWLRPLLQRIIQAPNTVAVPQMDHINSVDFEYVAVKELKVGGFTFAGDFHWIPMSEEENGRRESEIASARSPAMSGAAFAINRLYFWQLGGFEHKTSSWAGEDLEISFRIWQCGGSIEVIPCSRVGLVNKANVIDHFARWEVVQHINAARTSELWLDEYKELFYIYWPEYRTHSKVGDVTKRRLIRERLACRSFQWYLDHVYKEKFVPVRDTIALGRLRNQNLSFCLEKRQGLVVGSKCHNSPRVGQFFTLSTDGHLRDELSCIRIRRQWNETQVRSGNVLEYMPCDGYKKEKWIYNSTHQLYHVGTELCLSSSLLGLEPVTLERCRKGAPQQKWIFDRDEKKVSTEEKERLRYIHNQRRSVAWPKENILTSFLKDITHKYTSASLHRNKMRTREFTRR